MMHPGSRLVSSWSLRNGTSTSSSCPVFILTRTTKISIRPPSRFLSHGRGVEYPDSNLGGLTMKYTKLALITIAIAGLSTSAFAQLPTTKILTMDVAQMIAQEALAKCRADGYKVTVLVVDSLNAPKAMLRDDGATASTTEVAKMNATATMLYNRPSGPATPPPAGTAAPPATIPGTINAQGGVPIKVGDATIGAVAVSGAPGGDKDAACANAGIQKASDKLR